MTNAELRVSTASPSQWGRVLSIEVPRARYDAVRAEVLRDLRRKIVRPGFRKGHVPSTLVEREFGSRIESDTLEKFLPDVCGQAIESQSLEPISSPRVRNLVLDDPEVVRLELALDVRPMIDTIRLEGLRGERWKVEISDAEVRAALEAARQENAQFATVEREARDHDILHVSYVPLDSAGREIASKKVENYRFVLGSGGFVPEFETALRGLASGATARAEVAYPPDHEDADLAGRTVAFVLTLEAVKERRVAELDDEFARDLGLEDLAALERHVRSDLERRRADESERHLRDSLADAVVQANPFEAPESMVEQYVEAAIEDIDRNMRRYGRELEPERRQELAKAARPSGERGAKRALALQKLSEEHSLSVSEEEVDRWIEDKVQASGSGGAEVRAFFTDVRRRRRLRAELTDDKVFEFLKSQAEITEVDRPVEVQHPVDPSGAA